MASRFRECRCGRRIPIEWIGDCVECREEFALKHYTGEAEVERDHRRLNALMNRGLELPGLDPNDPVIAKALDGIARVQQREGLLLKRQVHRQLAAQAAIERLHWEPDEE